MEFSSIGALLLATALGATAVAPASGGNALTLPSQRHLVRVPGEGGRPDTLLVAIQQGGREGRGLGLYRSEDGGAHWSYLAPIQDDASHADTADLLVSGRDVALVYGWEAPSFSGSTRHDIWFAWWRYQPTTRTWRPEPAVRVFDETRSDRGFARPMLARDSRGRLWVQSFRNLAGGGSDVHAAVSEDGGASFIQLPVLGGTPARGGGVLFATGGRVIMLYDGHDAGTPARWRWRDDSWPLDQWAREASAFTDGIYHGAALSVAGDGAAGAHLVYKDEAERLWYRHFDGTGFGARTSIESTPDWALQPAVTRMESGEVVVFYNRVLSTGSRYELRARVLRDGVWGAAVRIESPTGFKGYPAALEFLPGSAEQVPCLWGDAPNASDWGQVVHVSLPWTPTGPAPDAGTPDAGTPDAGTPDAGIPDAGTPDAGTPDAGTPDAGTPDAGEPDAGGSPDAGPSPGEEVLLFSDEFERSDRQGLGASWTLARGLWRTAEGYAISDLDGPDQAFPTGVECADCRVEFRFNGFGVPEVAAFARAHPAAPADRYELAILSDRRVELRRRRGSSVVVLGQAPSGLTDLTRPAVITLEIAGVSPVELVGRVNGTVRVVASDSDPGALQRGVAGLWTTRAGVWFDDFRLWSLGTGVPDAGVPDAGVPDAGMPDAGVPDAGVPDAGVPDAGAPDGGVPDAGVPDAGVPDAGVPDAGVPDAGVPDAGVPDAGVPDAGVPDAGVPDAGVPDAGVPDAGVPDAGVPDAGVPDAGVPDAGVQDAGVPDSGVPPADGGTGTLRFTDTFYSPPLKPNWSPASGRWEVADSRAISRNAGPAFLGLVTPGCVDCRIEVELKPTLAPGASVALRAQSGAQPDRYSLTLTASGELILQRWRGGVAQTLASAPSGLARLDKRTSLALEAQGTASVALRGFVGGRLVLLALDAPTLALHGGVPGLGATAAGTSFETAFISSLPSWGGGTSP